MAPLSESLHDDSPFWRFSLRFYSRAAVAAACLTLQDEAGVDVNLMLFLLYLAEHKRSVSEAEISRLDRAVAEWRGQVVKPLRGLRRALKSGVGDIPVEVSESFRAQIKRLELDSEKIEQHVLERFGHATLGTEVASRMDAAQANLAAYAANLGRFSEAARLTILAAFNEFGRHHPAGIA
jgi:uncharacterized protein (TIGR02444 family)